MTEPRKLVYAEDVERLLKSMAREKPQPSDPWVIYARVSTRVRNLPAVEQAMTEEQATCPDCEGTGYIVRPPSAYDVRVGESRRWHDPCPDCGGVGHWPGDPEYRCVPCGGSGSVPVDRTEEQERATTWRCSWPGCDEPVPNDKRLYCDGHRDDLVKAGEAARESIPARAEAPEASPSEELVYTEEKVTPDQKAAMDELLSRKVVEGLSVDLDAPSVPGPIEPESLPNEACLPSQQTEPDKERGWMSNQYGRPLSEDDLAEQPDPSIELRRLRLDRLAALAERDALRAELQAAREENERLGANVIAWQDAFGEMSRERDRLREQVERLTEERDDAVGAFGDERTLRTEAQAAFQCERARAEKAEATLTALQERLLSDEAADRIKDEFESEYCYTKSAMRDAARRALRTAWEYAKEKEER